MVLNFPNAAAFNMILHVMMTFNHKVILLLLHTCNFANIMDHNVNIFGDREVETTGLDFVFM